MSTTAEGPKTVDLRGIKVYPFTSPDDLIDFADSRKGILVALNAEKIGSAKQEIKEVINANIGYCDGEWAAKAARQKGAEVKKIAGCELWLHIVRRFFKSRSFYVIGATPEVHAATIAKLRSEFKGINIVGSRDGYIKNDAERQALIDDVADKKPDVVFVAMGSPKQEFLMADMLSRHKAIYQGLGGSFDVYTGKVQRAPKWWIDHNLEAAYRLVTQPTKRFKRNLVYIKYMWWLACHKF